MSEPIQDGGPAFPQNDLSGYGMGPAEKNNGGMSLRDWFAGQALAGMLADPNIRGGDGLWPLVAGDAYKAADAMLAARVSA